MAISIDWATKVITVPQADLTHIVGTLYELDTDWFRLQLKALEASETGMTELDTHSHNTQYTVAGTTYARKVEITNGYSVQFTPNSQWSVRLAGSNNNIFDVESSILVQNQVQVIAQNAAGLIVTEGGGGEADWQTAEKRQIRDALGIDGDKTTATGGQLQALSTELEKVRHADGVFISNKRGAAGTAHDFGTRANPVNGQTLNGAHDAVVIAVANGTRRFVFLDDDQYALGQAFVNWAFEGETIPIINMNGQDLVGSIFSRCYIWGTGSPAGVFESFIASSVISTVAFRSVLAYGTTIDGGDFYQCFFDTATITVGGNFDIRDGSGNFTLSGMTTGNVRISNFCGTLTIDSSCTGGTITVDGQGTLNDNNGGATVNKDGWVSNDSINAECDLAIADYDPPTRAEATADKDEILSDIDGVWDEQRTNHTDAGSFGATSEWASAIDAAAIAAAVWDAVRTLYATPGTFGATDEWASAIDAAGLRTAIWDADKDDYNDPDTMGELQNTGGSGGGLDADAVASAVWDAIANQYGTPGTMGWLQNLIQAGLISSPRIIPGD